MPLRSSALALSAFPVTETRDFKVMRHSMLNHYGATKFEVPQNVGNSDGNEQTFDLKIEAEIKLSFKDCQPADSRCLVLGFDGVHGRPDSGT